MIDTTEREMETLVKYKLITREEANEWFNIMKLLKQNKIPETYDMFESKNKFHHNQLSNSSTYVRSYIVPLQGFALLYWSWIRPLASWIGNRKCMEIMAGCGSLTKCLQDCGVKIFATDNYEWHNRESYIVWNDSWTEIEKIDCVEAINKYGKDIDIIICSWPEMNDIAYHCLCAMRNVNPNCIMIYIGEPYMGCTASDLFFENAEYIENDSFNEITKIYKPFASIRDGLFIVK